jgi:transposase
MWTDETRARYDRRALRYTHDLTDEEWAEIAPLIPPSRPGGNKRTVNMREVVNGLMYILGTGCQWRDIPKDLPPRSTIYDYLDRWIHDDTLERIHHILYVQCRELADREASPTAAVIDSQSVKSAEKGGSCIDPHGYDAGKKIKGKKRHIVVDTTGLLMHAIVHAADVQDRDGGVMLMATLRIVQVVHRRDPPPGAERPCAQRSEGAGGPCGPTWAIPGWRSGRGGWPSGCFEAGAVRRCRDWKAGTAPIHHLAVLLRRRALHRAGARLQGHHRSHGGARPRHRRCHDESGVLWP